MALVELPNPSVTFLHRKFVGILMLCRRLRARVDLAGLLRPLSPRLPARRGPFIDPIHPCA